MASIRPITLSLFTFGLLCCFLLKNVLSSSPPPHAEYAKRARYDVNNVNWATITYMKADDPMKGRPFPRPESMADGPVGAGTGVPYFYLMKEGGPMKSLYVNSNVTLGISEVEIGGLPSCKISNTGDPQMPTCARVLIFGNVYIVKDKKELAFATDALFQRHPAMKSFPPGHDFMVTAVNITDIWILDFFGGPVYVDVNDYFNVNSTEWRV